MTHAERIAELRKKPVIISGATEKEINTIKAALNLYRTRSSEKHTEHPRMGWDDAAKSAEELEMRIVPG